MSTLVTRRSARTAAFADFLRARRCELHPEEFGLQAHARRRVRGLRREEVAHLAGVSNVWYTRLEQGANVQPTVEVVDAIARALRLDHDAHCHLRRLAHLPDDVEPEATCLPADDLNELVDQFLPSPAWIVDEYYDFLAWNAGYELVFGVDLRQVPEAHRNLLWLTFAHPHAFTVVEGRDEIAAAMIAHFRWISVARIGEPRLAELVGELSEVSAEFRAHWSRAAVSRRAVPPLAVDHPKVGTIRLRGTMELRLQDRPAFVKVKLPATEDDRALLRLLLADQ